MALLTLSQNLMKPDSKESQESLRFTLGGEVYFAIIDRLTTYWDPVILIDI
jgi:hypothetical protein